MVRVHHDRPSPRHGMLLLVHVLHVASQGGCDNCRHNEYERAQPCEREEWHMPIKMCRQVKPQRNANNGGNRKRGHHHPHRRSSPLARNHVADDGQNHRAHHAPESSGDKPRRHQKLIRWRQSAEQRSEREAKVKPEQSPFAIKPIQKKSRRQTGHPGTDAIRGNDQAKLPGVNVKNPHVLRSQRQDD